MDRTLELISKFPEENPNPVLRIDDRGVLLYSNEAGLGILEMWNCRVGETIPGPWNDEMTGTLSANARKNFILEIQDRIYSLLAVPIPSHRYVNIYGSDITRIYNLQDELKEIANRFRSIFDNTAVGIIERDRNNRIINVNGRMCQILQYKPEELLGKNVREFTYPADLKVSEAVIAQLKKNVDLSEYEKRYVRKDGKVIWVRVIASVIRNGKGAIEKTIATVEDITRRRETEQELKLSESRFRSTFENAAVGMAHISMDGKWLRINDTLCRITGYLPEELQQMTFSKLIHPADIPSRQTHPKIHH